MPRLTFYTTAGCHLCEFAAEMMAWLESNQGVEIETVDIAGDEILVERYGLTIPVVKNPITEEELNWPFEMEQLLSLF